MFDSINKYKHLQFILFTYIHLVWKDGRKPITIIDRYLPRSDFSSNIDH